MRIVKKKKDIKARPRLALLRHLRLSLSECYWCARYCRSHHSPLTSIHKAFIIAQLLYNHLILEWFLLLPPCHGLQEDHLVALKVSPDSQIPSQGSRALICHSNQQSPTGLLNQWTALPDQGLGVTPPAMDRH